ncbi:heterokaryon incompatibility protein-domain-containing protein [Pisolithus croceorrhizus]|nr:heterokaryon incompatibility protein-domain-containing protein [Pisolithus croceorrhizus]
MKLLDVEVVLSIRNKGIQQTRHKPEVMKELDDATAHYAILSHRWEEPEVKYEEMIRFTKMEEEERKEVKRRHGYQKIIKSCEQAVKDGYKWLWIDTCCIDKRSSSEQSEAINSMYRWYQNAQVCYVYLNDVDESTFPAEQDLIKFAESNGWPEWFMRGWTLQELIAPKEVKFFNKDWEYIDSKCQLASTLKRITGIPHEVLTSGLAEDRLSVAQIMSWAARRVTTRVEDRAYSLMGLFRVNMPMVYGEGKKAFQRLQLEVIRVSSDQSIFAWSLQIPRAGSVLAEDPSDFWDCGEVRKVETEEFMGKLWEYTTTWQGLSEPSRSGIAGQAQHRIKLVAWLRGVDSQEFHTFTISNVGIQMLLPVVPSRDSPSHCRAILACTRDSDLVTIDLVSSGRSFARTSINSLLPAVYPEFKTLHLIHHQDTNETRRQFALDDKYASYHGFTRRGTYPRKFTDNTFTLSSLVDDLIVIVYANDGVGAWFSIGLGYYLGQEWVHVDCDGRSPTEEKSWTDVGQQAYNRMWKARTTHAMSTFKRKDPDIYREGHFVKLVHLSQSIWAVRVIWGRWEADNSKHEDGLRGDRQLTAAESDPRIEPALIWLRKWSRIFAFSSFVQLQYANERLTVEGEIKSISQTLGADVSVVISEDEQGLILTQTATRTYKECLLQFLSWPQIILSSHGSMHPSTEATGQVDRMKYDRQLDTASMLQDIKTLQVKFEATNDEDEQRTLEEDITGKVVDFIRKEEGMKRCLVEIPWVIASTEPADDQMHLQRIMYDAGAKTSKYQLWLDARAREQARWSGTNSGSPTIGDQANMGIGESRYYEMMRRSDGNVCFTVYGPSLPHWPYLSHNDCMVGKNSASCNGDRAHSKLLVPDVETQQHIPVDSGHECAMVTRFSAASDYSCCKPVKYQQVTFRMVIHCIWSSPRRHISTVMAATPAFLPIGAVYQTYTMPATAPTTPKASSQDAYQARLKPVSLPQVVSCPASCPGLPNYTLKVFRLAFTR